MKTDEAINRTPWDSEVFGLDTYEIQSLSVEVLKKIIRIPGHYTVKVAPLSSKKLLHDYGFYYCDTLLEPFCGAERIVSYKHDKITISRKITIDDIIDISHGAFSHGRFHRDFNLDRQLADVRYDNWLRELCDAGDCFGFLYENKIAGFIGFRGNKFLLHALSAEFRGQGLAKYFWSAACEALFALGYEEITSSISASNVAALNLYASLGFRFRNPVDVYHLLNT